jgi:hypothetical protein
MFQNILILKYIFDIDKKNTDYEENIHYIYFNILKVDTVHNNINKKYERKIYLTYKGSIRVLFVSRSKNVDKIQDWVCEILFTHQFGTLEQKHELISTSLGVKIGSIREVFDKEASTIPCIYFISLGTVKNLRESFDFNDTDDDPIKYKDNNIVYKFGFAKKLTKRLSEHENNYGKINGVDLRLSLYQYIDPQYICEAERSVRGYFESINKRALTKIGKEFVILDNKSYEKVKEQYEMIGKKYMGHSSELITKIKDLENNMKQLKLECELEKQQLITENQKLENELKITMQELRIKDLEYRLKKKNNRKNIDEKEN